MLNANQFFSWGHVSPQQHSSFSPSPSKIQSFHLIFVKQRYKYRDLIWNIVQICLLYWIIINNLNYLKENVLKQDKNTGLVKNDKIIYKKKKMCQGCHQIENFPVLHVSLSILRRDPPYTQMRATSKHQQMWAQHLTQITIYQESRI